MTRHLVLFLAFVCLALLRISAQTLPQQPSKPAGNSGTSAAAGASKADYSKEGFIIDQYVTRAEFQADGTGSREVTAAIHAQADSAVRMFAVLAFPYTSDNETVDVDYVRVRKPDGSLVATPAYNIQEMPAEVTRIAPMYSDIHEKHVTVKALDVGDVLEYRVRYRITKPEIPGQFWFEHSFTSDAIVKDEQLEITVPRTKYVKLSSPGQQPQIKDDGDRRIYTWRTNNFTHKDKDAQAQEETPGPSVSLSTFHTWDEIGKWYAGLQRPQLEITPAIRAKAAELTKGLTSDDDKIRALYDFVSTRCHYVSLSFGIGRYQPHAADDVLGNEYGDCKDKHTLLAALLKAAGYNAWPALINSSRKIDTEVPSPGQFDHVITVVPRGSTELWMDTTPEVAPFRVLLPKLRDKEALVIPDDKPASLQKTPADLPFLAKHTFTAEGKLATDGTYTGHAQLVSRGDSEVVLRGVFRLMPPAKWKDVVQGISYGLNFGGDVSNVFVSSPEDTSKPFEISYDYTRKNYSDWANHRIGPPLPPFGLQLIGNDEKKPSKPIRLGDGGEFVWTARVQLPPGFTAKVPVPKLDLVEDYAEYHATYNIADNIFTAIRRLIVKKDHLQPQSWDNFVAFRKTFTEDEGKYTELSGGGSVMAKSGNDASRKFQEGVEALQRNDATTAGEAFRRVLEIDPHYAGAHANLGIVALRERDMVTATAQLAKEEELHPDNSFPYRWLAMLYSFQHRNDDAATQWRKLVALEPTNRDAVLGLSNVLITQKKYADAVGVLEKGLKDSPDSSAIKLALGSAYLKSGQKEKGASLVEEGLKDDHMPMRLNNAAFELADNNVALDKALDYAQDAVQQGEAAAAKSSPDNQGLRNTSFLPYYWDTLGWVYFRRGEYEKATTYVRAAWKLSEKPDIGDHLGQLYERLGRKAAAAHMYLLAWSASGTSSSQSEARGEIAARYERLTGKKPNDTPQLSFRRDAQGKVLPGPMSPAEELSRMRSVTVPLSADGNAQFTVVLTRGKVENVTFVSGDDNLEKAGKAIAAAKFNVEFPDDGPEKIVRRGFLSCYQRCDYVVLNSGDAAAMQPMPPVQ